MYISSHVEREIAALKDMIAILENAGRRSKRGYTKRKPAIVALAQIGVPAPVIARQVGIPAWYVRKTLQNWSSSCVETGNRPHERNAEAHCSPA